MNPWRINSGWAACILGWALLAAGAVQAQSPVAEQPAAEQPSSFAPSPSAAEEQSSAEKAVDKASEAAKGVAKKVDEFSQQVDQDKRAIELTGGILRPIYQLAEWFSFSFFHWIAFALMVAGTVSYAGQLVLGKLVMLAKRHFSLVEIFSDGLGLAISVVGLVLTTQAATENSNFTTSPFAVLSATAVGVVVGFILYIQGQTQEIRAAQSAPKSKSKSKS